ncbi:MAG TPA: cupin domain-containing protein [Solirubrobacteraceae bacterium]|jgi:quercetin dioxygenase-like cupin family protein|nr:cupin domain-containing protein [Solirubrobacteraceae bacterium]
MIVSRRRDDAAPSEIRAETFTGGAWADPRLRAGQDGVTVNDVFFPPTARTDWHRHERGQLLLVAHGLGLAQVDGESPHWIGPGDIVYFPAGEKHWHGAGPATYLLHTAISLGTTEWQEEVTTEQYDDAIRASGPPAG